MKFIHFQISSEGDGQTERTNNFGTVPPSLLHYQQDNWSELLPLAEFAIQYSECHYRHYTFLPQGITEPTVQPERDLASARAHDFVTDLDGYTNNMTNIADAHIDTKLLLIPTIPAPDSKLEAMFMSSSILPYTQL